MQTEDKQKLDANVQKVVSQSALRKMGRLADETKRDDVNQSIFAKRLLAATGVVFATVLVIYLISPQTIVAALRTATASIR